MLDLEDKRAELETELTHPTMRALYEFWRALPAENGLPGRQHVDPAAIHTLLPWIFMVDVERSLPGPVFRYRLAGTGIVELFDLEITGRTVEEAFPQQAAELNADYTRAMAATQPIRRRAPMPVAKKLYLMVDWLICPLASNGAEVDMLIGAPVPVSHKKSVLPRQSAA